MIMNGGGMLLLEQELKWMKFSILISNPKEPSLLRFGCFCRHCLLEREMSDGAVVLLMALPMVLPMVLLVVLLLLAAATVVEFCFCCTDWILPQLMPCCRHCHLSRLMVFACRCRDS